MTVDYAPALPMFVDRNRVWQNCNPRFAIILHKTAGLYSIEQLAYWFGEDPDNKDWVSSHFGIGTDGRIGQFAWLIDGAGANGKLEIGHAAIWDAFEGQNINFITVSIEHLDPSIYNDTPMTPAQKLASFQLVKFLMGKLNVDQEHILGHNTINPSTRAHCPGDTYPWAELYDYIDPDKTVFVPAIRKVTPNMSKSFEDQWDSTAHLMPKAKPEDPDVPARRPTGIYTEWMRFQAQGRNLGPPITPEYNSSDWNGKPIVAQEFTHVRAEYQNGVTKFYSVGGQLTY